jgi:hypothetical protein
MPKRARVGVQMTEHDVPMHRRTPIWRKVWALLAGSTMAVVTGMLAATLLGFSASWIVITLSRMLKK